MKIEMVAICTAVSLIYFSHKTENCHTYYQIIQMSVTVVVLSTHPFIYPTPQYAVTEQNVT
jgi:hypothetical protein